MALALDVEVPKLRTVPRERLEVRDKGGDARMHERADAAPGGARGEGRQAAVMDTADRLGGGISRHEDRDVRAFEDAVILAPRRDRRGERGGTRSDGLAEGAEGR
jgi:hypothetical protein